MPTVEQNKSEIRMFEKIYKLACQMKAEGDYRSAAVLSSILTDLAIQEEREILRGSLEKSAKEIRELEARLTSVGLVRLAKQVDIVARDLESRALAFSVEDPIETIIHSYKVIHRLARSGKPSEVIDEIRTLIESEKVPDAELPNYIKRMMLGLTDQEKSNVLYVIEKDYNLSIPLEKVALKKKKTKRTEEEKCLDDAKTRKERIECLDEQKPKMKMEKSFPTSPSIWSGFAYEAVIPYHQNSQLNFWSVASNEEKVLKRIAKAR